MKKILFVGLLLTISVASVSEAWQGVVLMGRAGHANTPLMTCDDVNAFMQDEKNLKDDGVPLETDYTYTDGHPYEIYRSYDPKGCAGGSYISVCTWDKDRCPVYGAWCAGTSYNNFPGGVGNIEFCSLAKRQAAVIAGLTSWVKQLDNKERKGK